MHVHPSESDPTHSLCLTVTRASWKLMCLTPRCTHGIKQCVSAVLHKCALPTLGCARQVGYRCTLRGQQVVTPRRRGEASGWEPQQSKMLMREQETKNSNHSISDVDTRWPCKWQCPEAQVCTERPKVMLTLPQSNTDVSMHISIKGTV
jgi:hypothetical protein